MDISFSRDLAIIWLSLFCVLGLCVPLLGLYFAVRAMNSLQQRSKQWLQSGQAQVTTVRQQADRLSERAVQPIVGAQVRMERAKTTLKQLTRQA